MRNSFFFYQASVLFTLAIAIANQSLAAEVGPTAQDAAKTTIASVTPDPKSEPKQDAKPDLKPDVKPITAAPEVSQPEKDKPSLDPQPVTPAVELVVADHKVPPETSKVYKDVVWVLNDNNKELIDYDDSFMDALFFVQTEKQAGAEAAKQVEAILAKHHNNEELYGYLLDLSQRYPDITRLYSIGESVEGRKIWAIEISEEPGKHQLLKPEFAYTANIHGNEAVGRELLLHLARLLVENYRAAQDEPVGDTKPSAFKFVKKLLKATRIHLIPSINPDGYSKSEVSCKYETPSMKGRYNANNIDLNRNFPDVVLHNNPDLATQPETRAIIEWAKSIPLVLSADIHTGSLVASYPYDGTLNLTAGKGYRATPDDDIFQHLARTYSTSHPTMASGKICYDECTEYHKEVFKDGITNGADWYSMYGSMQDWLYEQIGTLPLTIEVGCNQYPEAKSLPQYWQFNKRALLNYMKEVHRGVKGTVVDGSTGRPLSNVNVHVMGRDHNVSTSSQGDFFRILLPGFYDLIFEHPGYTSQKAFVSVSKSMAQIINVKLEPLASAATGNQSTIVVPNGDSKTEKPTEDALSSAVETKDHSLVVATLIMTIVTVLILLALAGAYVIQKRRFSRSRSVSLELQATRANLSTTGTGVSLPVGHTGAGSSQHLQA